MPKFLIEVPHEETVSACIKAIRILHESGSHFLTHADFGCHDGIHKAWIVVDLESKTEAKNLVPPAYRNVATVVQLNKFSEEELKLLMERHPS